MDLGSFQDVCEVRTIFIIILRYLFLWVNIVEKEKKDSAKSCLTLMIPQTVASQAPLSMGFSRQEYWSGLPFSSSGDLPNPGIEPRPPTLQADAFTD